ncbi:hypothetical protein BB558_003471 [Smittium angustum]|uniref:40S ribosomal protein S15 n=1 Tax=Smittium angustum TaxID=133377 RepID=A0A2U1J5Z9_SMIAN|nr:hypothetical protein BB558_003471 [Smittium angustum]
MLKPHTLSNLKSAVGKTNQHYLLNSSNFIESYTSETTKAHFHSKRYSIHKKNTPFNTQYTPYSTETFMSIAEKKNLRKNLEHESKDIWQTSINDIIINKNALEDYFKNDKYKPAFEDIVSIATKFLPLLTESENSSVYKNSIQEWYQLVYKVFNGNTLTITKLAHITFQVASNKAMALELYLCAYKHGDNDAAYSYATIKYIGAFGVEKNSETATNILFDLAKKGHPYAQLNLATIYIKEKKTEFKKQVVELLNLSAKGNIHKSHLKLGELYKKGDYLDQDFDLARHHLEIASSKGISEADFLLGDMFSKGQTLEGNEPDYKVALKLFEKAAASGVVEAQYNVGVYYMNGYGTDQSAETAIEYWDMAVMQGFPMAALNLAKLYLEGYPTDSAENKQVVKKDFTKSRHYLVAAKRLGKGSFIETDAITLYKQHFGDNSKANSAPSADATQEIKQKRTFRKFTFRGVELKQLLELSSEEFMSLLHARARRKFNRGIKRKPMGLIKKLRKAKSEAPEGEKPDVVKTHLRDMIIIPEMVGSIVGVYNGKTFNQVEIKPEMIGHYLAEFSISYKPVKHGRPGIGATNSSRFIPLK